MSLIYLEIINSVIIIGAVLTIFTAIIINFLESQHNATAKRTKRSIVETGSMTLFFIAFYLVMRFRIGIIENDNFYFRLFLMILGWIIILIGVYFNIQGRFRLGKNWANQIKIYKNQTLVTEGVYRIVRHPLYASLIWMFYAASLIYLNWLAFLLNNFIFIPFMYYRAKQEEKLLKEEFREYTIYQKNVGMFFPRFIWQKK